LNQNVTFTIKRLTDGPAVGYPILIKDVGGLAATFSASVADDLAHYSGAELDLAFDAKASNSFTASSVGTFIEKASKYVELLGAILVIVAPEAAPELEVIGGYIAMLGAVSGMISQGGSSGILSTKGYDLWLKHLGTIPQFSNKPISMPVYEAVPRGFYCGERLALNLGPLNDIGKWVLDNAKGEDNLANAVVQNVSIIPFHAFNIAYFPNMLMAVPILDYDGVLVNRFVRHCIRSEFVGALNGVDLQTGKGTIIYFVGMQYWDETYCRWVWTSDETKYSGFKGWNADMDIQSDVLDSLFLSATNPELVINQYLGTKTFEEFDHFNKTYLSIAAPYNVLLFNCQDVGKETMNFIRADQYPSWWSTKQIADERVEQLKIKNAQVAGTFVSADFDVIRGGLSNSDIVGRFWSNE